MIKPLLRAAWTIALAVGAAATLAAQEHHHHEHLPNIDRRRVQTGGVGVAEASPPAGLAASGLKSQLGDAKVEWHGVTRSPQHVQAREGFLTGPNGGGGAVSAASAAAVPAKDALRPVKTFLTEHRA